MKSSKAARNERNHRKAVMGHFGGMMNNEIENSTLDRLFDDVVHRNIMENPQPDVEDYDSDDSFPMVLFPRQENHVTSFSEPIIMVPEMRKERSSNQKELTKAERIATISAMVDELNLIIEKEAIWAQDQDIKTVSLLPQSSVSQIVYTSEIITKIFGDMNQTEPNIPATLTMVGLMMYGSIAPELLQVGPLFKPNRFDPTHMVYPHNPYYGDLSCHSIIPRQLDVRPVFEVPVDDDNEVQHCQWDQCHKTLRGLNTLVDHLIKEHVNYVINWTCKWRLCKRTKPFNAHYKLVIHLRRHTGERPHLCYYSNCKKRYARLENLKTHIRTHTGERPYGCEYAGCPKLFSNASDRAKHLSRTHSKVKSFMCIVVNCTKSYTDPSSLRKHIRTQHGNRCYDLTRLAKAQTHQDGLAYRILIQERVTDSSTSMQLMTVEELIARGILQPDMSSSNDENAFNENIDIDGFP